MQNHFKESPVNKARAFSQEKQAAFYFIWEVQRSEELRRCRGGLSVPFSLTGFVKHSVIASDMVPCKPCCHSTFQENRKSHYSAWLLPQGDTCNNCENSVKKKRKKKNFIEMKKERKRNKSNRESALVLCQSLFICQCVFPFPPGFKRFQDQFVTRLFCLLTQQGVYHFFKKALRLTISQSNTNLAASSSLVAVAVHNHKKTAKLILD